MSTVVVGTVQSNSTSPPTFKNTSGTEIGTLCRAFVNFNGTGTVAIRAAFNVSSITDNGTGNYTVNFTTAMPDANYAATVGGCYTDNNSPERNFGAVTEQFTTTSLKLFTTDMTSGSALDMAIISCSIFR